MEVKECTGVSHGVLVELNHGLKTVEWYAEFGENEFAMMENVPAFTGNEDEVMGKEAEFAKELLGKDFRVYIARDKSLHCSLV